MKKIIASVCALALATFGSPAFAAYPDKPITVIVPFAAGGPTDVLTRIVTEHMGRTLGQQLVVENVGGAGGTLGGTKAAKADPDGYTLIVGNLGSHGAAVSLYKNIQYDPRDLEAVGMVAGTPIYFAVKKDFAAKTFQEFLTFAKANPGKVTNAHAGVGSTSHLVCLFLSSLTGVKMQAVPYRGTGPAMNDLVAGQIDTMCDQAPTVVPQAQAGSIRALVTAGESRTAALPQTPTAKEVQLPGFLVTGWNAMFAPKGTPKDIITKVNSALNAALADATVQKRIETLGSVLQPKEQTPEGLKAFVKAEVEKWGKVIKEAGVEPQ